MPTLYVKAYVTEVYDTENSRIANFLYFQAVNYYTNPYEKFVIEFGTQNPSATPYPIFPNAGAAITYYKDTYGAILVNDVNTAIGFTYYTAYDVELVDSPVLAQFAGLTFDNIGDGTSNHAMTTAQQTKLTGIATGATANSSDATLLARANHTGTQSVSTVTGLATVATSGSYNDLSNKPSITGGIGYNGSTSLNSPILFAQSASVTSGVAVFQLTTNGLSTGTSIFPNGVVQDSVQVGVNDATAAYQMSWVFSNSNKTLTVTVNKLTTSNILTGILGQAAAPNATSIKVQLWGN